MKRNSQPTGRRWASYRAPLLARGIDRLDINLDIASPPPEIEALRGEKFEIVAPDVPFHPHWQTRIHVHQPSTELLKELDRLLRHRAQYQIYCVEMAVDYLPPIGIRSSEALEFFLASAHPRHGRTRVTFEGGTIYFKERTNAQGAKSEGVDVAYADRLSKLAAADDFPRRRAMHVEHRLAGKNDLERAGIITLLDLIDFDHAAFWRKVMVLVRSPSQTDVGRWLAGPDAATLTSVELQRLGKAWMTEHAVDGKFCLHNCWLAAGEDSFFRNLPRYPDLHALYADLQKKALRKASRTRKSMGY